MPYNTVEVVSMAINIRAHFDGKVIVPDEPVDLPVDQPLEVELKPVGSIIESSLAGASKEERLRRLAAASGRISGPTIPSEALRRENLYEERV
jgi:hypothetical protein